jgi:hypothetical protein
VIPDTWEARRSACLIEVAAAITRFGEQVEASPESERQDARWHYIAALQAINSVSADWIERMLGMSER